MRVRVRRHYAKLNIFMTAVDTGWITDEKPLAEYVQHMYASFCGYLLLLAPVPLRDARTGHPALRRLVARRTNTANMPVAHSPT